MDLILNSSFAFPELTYEKRKIVEPKTYFANFRPSLWFRRHYQGGHWLSPLFYCG